MYKNYILKW